MGRKRNFSPSPSSSFSKTLATQATARLRTSKHHRAPTQSAFITVLGFYSNCIVFTARFARCIVDLLALLPQMRYRTVNGELKILQNRSKCQF